MNYAEAAFFDRNHCQHVAAYFEVKRLARVDSKLASLRRGDRIRDRAFA